MNKFFQRLVCGAVLAAPGYSFQAQEGLNVSIQSPGQAALPHPSYPAASNQPGHWNRMGPPNPQLPNWSSGPMVNLAGAPSPITIEVQGYANMFPVNFAATTGNDELLLDDGLNIGPIATHSVQFTIHDLPPGPYTLYSYTLGWLTETQISVQGGSQTTDTWATFDQGFMEQNSYLVSHFVVLPNQPITVEVGGPGPSDRAVINGFQIIPSGIPQGTSYCPGTMNSTGNPARMILAGNTSVHANGLQLGVRDLPRNQFGYFLVSSSQGTGITPPGSQGSLCIGNNLGRFNRSGEALLSGTSGAVLMDIDLEDVPQPLGPIAVSPGESWNLQYWYRDNNPGATSNFSDANQIVFTD